MILLLGFFSTLKFIRLISHDQPEFVVNTVMKDMFTEYPEPFWANENRFELAVTFLSIRPYRFVEYDPRLGKLNMRRVEQHIVEDEIYFEKFPMPTAPCDPEVNFKTDSTKDFVARNMT